MVSLLPYISQPVDVLHGSPVSRHQARTTTLEDSLPTAQHTTLQIGSRSLACLELKLGPASLTQLLVQQWPVHWQMGSLIE